MSGGKSSSSAATNTTNTTAQQAVDGVTLAPVQQTNTGSFYTYDYFPTDVADAFKSVLEFANTAGGAAKDFATDAITAVSRREEQVSNPELATLTKFMPVLIVGVLAVATVMAFKAYKGN